MAGILETQHRLVYSLLRPAVRAAARFGVPVRRLTELMRLSYYEVLAREYGYTVAEIAAHFDQSERHLRSLAQRFRSDFFAAENEVGLGRQIEALVAAAPRTPEALAEELAGYTREQLETAVDQLIEEQRIERRDDGALHPTQRYVVLRSDLFHHRVDALNHFMDCAYGATLERLVFDNKQTAMVKTLSFVAIDKQLTALVAKLEADLRRELGTLDEEATFAGCADQYSMAICLTPVRRTKDESGDKT